MNLTNVAYEGYDIVTCRFKFS